ncbi:cytochrome b N-terminal domain-containing protein [Candidatus Pyrohabitans sp.]
MKRTAVLIAVMVLLALPTAYATVTAHDEGEEGGHGEKPGIGYIGLGPTEELDEHELEKFVERVMEEAYAKAKVDKIRFAIFALLFAMLYLAFARIKGLSEKLKSGLDWYTLGIITFILFIGLVIPSGIIITFFYKPSPTEAYYSVEVMAQNGALAFFRNLHNWSSEIFLFLMILHSARAVSTRTYLGRRKIIWVTGALLLIISWLSFLSGTFMRADQEALEGFEHMMYAFNLVPLGNYIASFFTGDLAIMKLTAFHIGLTTFAILLLTAPHMLMRKVYLQVQRRWKKALVYSAVLTVFLVMQSLFMEAPFIRGLEAGPTVSGIEITKPPWPIYFLVTGENLFGATTMVVMPLLAFLPLLIFPYVVERLPLDSKKKARAGELLYYAGAFIMLGISFWAATSEIVPHIFT